MTETRGVVGVDDFGESVEMLLFVIGDIQVRAKTLARAGNLAIQYSAYHAADEIEEQSVQIDIEIIVFLIAKGNHRQNMTVMHNRTQSCRSN